MPDKPDHEDETPAARRFRETVASLNRLGFRGGVLVSDRPLRKRKRPIVWPVGMVPIKDEE
jgi:hypothetical protein